MVHPDENLNDKGPIFVLDSVTATGTNNNHVNDLDTGEGVSANDPEDEVQEDSSIDDPNDEFDAGPVTENNDSEDEVEEPQPLRRSTRINFGKPEARLIEQCEGRQVGAVSLDGPEVSYLEALLQTQALEVADDELLASSDELALVGAGLGGGFTNTKELKVMKFKEAMASSDKDKWQTAVDKEHDCMKKHNVWKAVNAEDIPSNTTVITSTWAMKKKSNGTYRARLNARGFE